jgi:hypothetical protein
VGNKQDLDETGSNRWRAAATADGIGWAGMRWRIDIAMRQEEFDVRVRGWGCGDEGLWEAQSDDDTDDETASAD